MIDAAVVVVTYNHEQSIIACLTALHQLNPGPTELVVIDNASQDATVALIREHFPTLRIIEVRANLGFAGGCNWGAKTTTADVVVCVSPRFIPKHDWLEKLLRPFQFAPGAGVVGCKLTVPHQQRLHHAGGVLDMPLGLAKLRGAGQFDYGQYDALESVEYVCGAALAVRRDVWDTVNGMDEAFYPAYYEDVDLCTRVRQAGWNVLYTPAAGGYYLERSVQQEHMLRLFHLNRLRYLFKHFKNVWLMRVWMSDEMQYLQSIHTEQELLALKNAYLTWQMYFSGHERNPTINSLDMQPMYPQYQARSKTHWSLQQLDFLLYPEPEARPPDNSLFDLLNAYGRQVLSWLLGTAQLEAAQLKTQRSIYEVLSNLVLQRQASDAAVVLQGMLLAKVVLAQQEENRAVV